MTPEKNGLDTKMSHHSPDTPLPPIDSESSDNNNTRQSCPCGGTCNGNCNRYGDTQRTLSFDDSED